ncbi:hypothetical protein JIN84_15275 [Luteolibacter yonseiensis]|uniref:Uncharacterized protein n=1 Tax=Luteolibacter yonseiensis TaxID=1144680 RepID=A0A934VCY6_9BACT|nr:hypothetical protein [Luteolibacter yonseiensis]MBK1816984.1 hypothetical protein [Luteolibacter yonseiensis]
MKTKILTSFFVLLTGPPACATEIDAEAQHLIGLETAEPAARSLPPEVAAYGTVLSPAPLIDLFRQIDAAKAALEISQQTSDRVEKLFASGELVARKDVEAAQAQLVRDRASMRTLEDRLVLEWGPRFSKLAATDRATLLGDLLEGRMAIARLSVARSETVTGIPLAANLHVFGREMKPIRCTSISPATTMDPAFLSQGFFGVMETPDTPLAIGLTLTGSLEIRGEPRSGIKIPQAAVVFYLGKAWVYQGGGDGTFKRVEIPTDEPVDDGWFLSNGVIPPHPVVTKGAQSILSKETAGPAEE